ncbi:hypothetical protein ACX9R5_05015 [Rathayibacter sp. CAU 1779]
MSRADTFRSPWWYHPATGMLAAGFALAIGLGAPLAIPIAVLVFAVANAVLSYVYGVTTGVPIGRISTVARVLVTVLVAAAMLGMSYGARVIVTNSGAQWVAWVAAVAVGVGIMAYGRLDDMLIGEALDEAETDRRGDLEGHADTEHPS